MHEIFCLHFVSVHASFPWTCLPFCKKWDGLLKKATIAHVPNTNGQQFPRFPWGNAGEWLFEEGEEYAPDWTRMELPIQNHLSGTSLRYWRSLVKRYKTEKPYFQNLNPICVAAANWKLLFCSFNFHTVRQFSYILMQPLSVLSCDLVMQIRQVMPKEIIIPRQCKILLTNFDMISTTTEPLDCCYPPHKWKNLDTLPASLFNLFKIKPFKGEEACFYL